MEVDLHRDTGVPLYQQIVQQIRDQIRSGTLRPGTRLPAIRELAGQLRLTRLTVHSAYSELQSQGLIDSHVGRGTYVAERDDSELQGRVATPASWVSGGVLAELLSMTDQPGMLSFTQATPDPETYPMREVGAALRRAARHRDALSYGTIAGDAGLRDALTQFFHSRGIAVASEQMLVTGGAQQGIDVVLRALVPPNDVILVEAPTYPGILELAAQTGRHVVGVPQDGDGLRIDALEAACIAYRPRLLYIVPTFGNPTGAVLSVERRVALLQVARANDLLILEDDVYGGLGYDAPPPLPLKHFDSDGRVLYLTSFSKMLAPGLRLGVLAAPSGLLPQLSAAKGSSDLVCSTLLQRTLADFLRGGHMEPHLREVRTVYRERRDALIAALEQHVPNCAWTYPSGGLSLWVTLPDGVDERSFVGDAIDAGVGVAPGRAFFASPQPRGYLRLSFGTHAPHQIEKGVSILGDVLQRHMRTRTELVSRASRMVSPLV